MSKNVTCVIPVYNGERFIGPAIDSVLAQSCPVHEIVVVDDGSTDATRQRVAAFGQSVTYVYQENRGSAAARNHGIRCASGDFIAFLDADDLWQPDKIALQLRRFLSTPRLAACSTYMQNFWMDEVADEARAQDGRLTAPQPGVASTLMARTSVFRAIGLLDERLHHRDIQDWLIRVRTGGWDIETLPEVLVRRRVHGGNVSRNRVDSGDQELLRLAFQTIARKRRGAAA